MKFEHIIQINDFNQALVPFITRNQLWQGLVYRAESPIAFMDHIDDVTILERGEDWIERQIVMGKLTVHDKIEYAHEVHVHYHTAASAEHGGGQMIMKIEEPSPDALFVRFTYITPHPESPDPETAHYLEFLKSAWRETDIDTIRKIRELAALGQLG
nr:AtaL-like protein [uncultured Deefgea sp.]